MSIFSTASEKVQYYRLDVAAKSAAERGNNARSDKMAALHHEIGKNLAGVHIENYPAPTHEQPAVEEQYARLLADVGFFALAKAERFHRRNRRVAARDIGLNIGMAITENAALSRSHMLDRYYNIVFGRFVDQAEALPEPIKSYLPPAKLRHKVQPPSRVLQDIPYAERPAAAFAEIYDRIADEGPEDIGYCAVGGVLLDATLETTLLTLSKETEIFHAAVGEIKALTLPIQA